MWTRVTNHPPPFLWFLHLTSASETTRVSSGNCLEMAQSNPPASHKGNQGLQGGSDLSRAADKASPTQIQHCSLCPRSSAQAQDMALSARSVVGCSSALSTPTPKVSAAPASSEHLSLQEPPALITLFLSSHRGQLKVIESYFHLCFPLQSSPSLGLSGRAREQVSGMYTPATLPKVPSALGKCKHFPSPQTESPPSFLFKMTPPTTHTLPLNLPIWHTQKLILKDLEYVFLLHRWDFSTEKQLQEKADNKIPGLLRAHLTPRTG